MTITNMIQKYVKIKYVKICKDEICKDIHI